MNYCDPLLKVKVDFNACISSWFSDVKIFIMILERKNACLVFMKTHATTH